MTAIWNFILQGGVVMFPLLVCSILALAVIIEKMVTLKKKRVIRPEILEVLADIRKPEDVGLAVSFCNRKSGVFASLVCTSLNSLEIPAAEIKEILSDQGRQEIRTLERGLNILETVATIAPVLGLLGTVLGMIKVFNVISIQGVGDPATLSGGISEALISTAAGLAVAIPTLVFYNYLSHKAESLILDIEKHINDLLLKLRYIR
ncbi:MAG: MotA/TolQ/ExbB proton channel family protein [Candidatus Cloacimonetes bacterium]|nr:MotA/TolQ/ExbB proton channel family protein [Candidatus Cloacimonadota bacterium]